MNAITNIPVWVFVIFFLLLCLGLQQSRPNTMSRGRVLVMPIVMTGFSINAVVQLFGFHVLGVIVWIVAFCLAIGARRRFRSSVKATFSVSKNQFFMEGSWLPLCLMMTMFLLRFISTAGIARHPELAHAPIFANLMTLGFGLISGAFVARGVLIFGKAYGPEKAVIA